MKKTFAETVSDYIFNKLQSKLIVELEEIVAECQTMTESNVGWGVYELKYTISVMARAEIARRKNRPKIGSRKATR